MWNFGLILSWHKVERFLNQPCCCCCGWPEAAPLLQIPLEQNTSPTHHSLSSGSLHPSHHSIESRPSIIIVQPPDDRRLTSSQTRAQPPSTTGSGPADRAFSVPVCSLPARALRCMASLDCCPAHCPVRLLIREKVDTMVSGLLRVRAAYSTVHCPTAPSVMVLHSYH